MKDEIKEEKKDEKLERKKLKRRERAEKRQHKHMGISLRWFVTFLIIVLCAGIMLVYSLMSSRLYVQRYQEQLEKNVMAQAEYLKNNLLENHMTSIQCGRWGQFIFCLLQCGCDFGMSGR